MDVTHLEIPAELMGLLEAAAGECVLRGGRHRSQPLLPIHPYGGAASARCAAAAREVNAGCVVLVPPPALQPDSQLTLPLDINEYPMAKYVRGHFQVRWAPAAGNLPRGQPRFGDSSVVSAQVQGPPRRGVRRLLPLPHRALPRLRPRGCCGVREGPDPGGLRCCREPAAASLPPRGFLSSPEAGGTPLRLWRDTRRALLDARRGADPETLGRETRSLCSRDPSPIPGLFSSLLLLASYFCRVFPSPQHPK